jgi:hypothetical protein
MAILDNFALLVGLNINRAKSAFVPLSVPQRLILSIQTILTCAPTSLPITYLGLPLSILMPTTDAGSGPNASRMAGITSFTGG